MTVALLARRVAVAMRRVPSLITTAPFAPPVATTRMVALTRSPAGNRLSIDAAVRDGCFTATD